MRTMVIQIWCYLAVFLLLIHKSSCRNTSTITTFYLRNYFAKCLQYDKTRQVFVFSSICREKFQWSSGTKFIHVPTNKCINVNSTADGSFLGLSSRCDSTSNLFQYDQSSRTIIHLISGKCLYPESGPDNPSSNIAVVIKSGCHHNTNKYYFRPNAYYIIRHFSGFCWVHVSSSNYIKLQNPNVCDRFQYENNYHLRHVNTGKCVTYKDSRPQYLRLTDDCRSPKTIFNQNNYSNIELSTNYCIHPYTGIVQPPLNDYLIRHNSCKNEDRARFTFFDERDTIKVKIISNTCDDIVGSCTNTIGHIIVNGRQHSSNIRGVNTALFDYRSGLYESRMNYDVYGNSSARTDMANYLNALPSRKILFMAVRDSVTFDSSSAEALKRYGVSATFATTNLAKSRCSMATIAYTGGGRKDWEMSVNKVGGAGASIIEQTIYIFRDLDGKDDCSEEMGIQTRKILDSAFSAKSIWDNDKRFYPHRARLNDRLYHGWCSGRGSPVSDYLQVDLGKVKSLTGLAIQGSSSSQSTSYVTKFSLKYSTDGSTWFSYKDIGSSNPMVFDGIHRLKSIETRVNWFHRIVARYLKIVPSARAIDDVRTCLRIEIYGCTQNSPKFVYDDGNNTNLETLGVYSNSFKVYYAVPTESKSIIEISTAADNKTLGNNIDQLEIQNVTGSIANENGTLEINAGIVEIIKSQSTKTDSIATIEFKTMKPSYYKFNVNYTYKVLDAGRPSGNVWQVLSFQNNETVFIYTKPFYFKRNDADKGILHFNVTNLEQRRFMNGESIRINISLSHLLSEKGGSRSNAYNIDIFFYYDSSFIEFKSITFYEEDQFSLAPSSNKTRKSVIHLHTHALWLLNNQHLSIHLRIKNPDTILKGDKCKGEFLIDFKYHNNLQQFNGKVNTTKGKIIPYQCKIGQKVDASVNSVRYDLPQLSMLYDVVNGEFIFCIQRASFATRYGPFCYRQRKGNDAWYGISNIAIVLGMDTSARILYGRDRTGNVYFQATYPFTQFYHIEESLWKIKEGTSAVRKAITVPDVSALPLSASQKYSISVSGIQLWVATKSGILRRKDGVLKRVIAY